MQVIHTPELDAMGDRFSALPMQPLKVTVRTLQPVITTEPLHLDGLLAYAVVKEATHGKMLGETSGAYWIPLPLEIERIHDGLPLWRSTNFREIDSFKDHSHYHQRGDANPYEPMAVTHTLTRKRPNRMPPTTEGQYMSYRVPIQRITADRWEATCVGNREEILRLLGYLQYVGKKGAYGYGRVYSWQVEAVKSFVLRDRPIPCQTAEECLQGAAFMGWTPPYRHRGTWRLCRA
jgi:CRISPR type IV-associated protein Csf3